MIGTDRDLHVASRAIETVVDPKTYRLKFLQFLGTIRRHTFESLFWFGAKIMLHNLVGAKCSI